VILVDREALARCHDRPCEWCGSRGTRHNHHVFGRGLGGGKRVDADWTLCCLCWTCHNDVHHGEITRESIIAIVAARCEVLQPDIEEAWRIICNLTGTPQISHVRWLLKTRAAATRNTRRLVLTTVRRKRELCRC
jgi:hypothetical protein